MSYEVNCHICGVVLLRQFRGTNAKFSCFKCKLKRRKERYEEYYKNKVIAKKKIPKPIRNCIQCGKEGVKQLYCSDRCSYQYRK